MSNISQQQIEKRYDELARDQNYINQLIADMFYNEKHDRIITIEDVNRLKLVIFNTPYLHDIVMQQLIDELCTDSILHKVF